MALRITLLETEREGTERREAGRGDKGEKKRIETEAGGNEENMMKAGWMCRKSRRGEKRETERERDDKLITCFMN